MFIFNVLVVLVFAAEKVTGTVKWFNVKSGYGFINRNDTKEDVFVHQTAIIKNNPKKAVRSVGDGEIVEFDVVLGDKGNEAANVTGPEGEAVRGSPFAADKRRGFRLWRQRTRRRAPNGEEGDENGNDENGTGDGQDGEQKQRPRRFRPRRGKFNRNGRPRPRNNDGDGGGADDSAEGGENATEETGQNGASNARNSGGGGGRRFFRRNFRGERRRKSENEGGQSDSQPGNNGEDCDGEAGGAPRRRRNPRFRRNRRPNSNQNDQVSN